ncbi:heavy-metal-associated domain-containing protein [Aeromonas cavernicola]|uniref:Mercuric reductase n=1 Tax=Aeromonas cavernicola TaxID=1006623 RepID=A0A2H9U1U5_9GAMM|nr:heavy metal-associated domain-containing protein [Aeromonas cavernicola]PJG58037.1 mercuric reductase [Aeromonas cavernicola]
MIIELSISGMSCGGCAASLQKALLAQPAITAAEVDFSRHQAVVDTALSRTELVALIEAQGFIAE